MKADYQALSTIICQKFERMSKAASTGNYSLSPLQDRAWGRISLLHTAGTIKNKTDTLRTQVSISLNHLGASFLCLL